MNILLEKQSSTDGTIKIQITESDYLSKLDNKLKEYSRKANIKGFRQGKVPTGVIRKMFGKSLLVDEVNHLISHTVSNYIKENKLKILGDPIPNQEKAQRIDWDTQKDFDFEFQIGMAEDFIVDLSPKIKKVRYLIEVTPKVVEEALEQTRKRYGQITHPEVSGVENDLYGEIWINEEAEKKPSVIQLKKVNKNSLDNFIGIKVDDVITFTIENVSDDPSIVAQILNTSEEDAKGKKGSYYFKVNTINHVEPAELNQEFFDKVFGKDIVKSAEEFSEKVKETIAANYLRESEHLLEHELEHYFVDHIKIALPENFLKNALKNGEGNITEEILEKEFEGYTKGLKWNLIKSKIAEDNQIEVQSMEVREMAKVMILQQFGGAAVAEQLGDKMDTFADNYLHANEGKNFMTLYNQLRHEKIMKVIREKISITEKTVSLEAFKKIVEGHNH